MTSSTGSDIVSILALLTICTVVLLLLRHYLPLRSTPAFLSVPIFLALALPTSAILLLPIDLTSTTNTAEEDTKGVWLPEKAILVSWRIIYWLTFVLTWALLPFIAEYMDAGHRDHQSRIWYSLRSNGRYQLIMLSCGVLGLIYMILSYGFDFTAIKGLIMALAYVFGLILAIYLMGHGLVAIPRRLIRNANIADRLKRVQSGAPRIHEKLEDAVIALEDIEASIEQLRQRKTGVSRDLQDWIDDLADLASQTPSRVTLATPGLDPVSKVPTVITERYLADLTRRFHRARHQRSRHAEEWDHTVQLAVDLQAVLDSKASKSLTFGRPSPSASIFGRYSVLTPYLRYHVHVNVVPALRLVSGVVLAAASLAIVQSEIIRFPAPQFSAVSLTVVHKPLSKDYQIGLGGQITAAFWITYMVFCALSSMTTVPTWNQRSLVRRNTYPESACWYAGQIAKLTVPLAYNFLTFLPKNIHEETTFYKFLGKLINLTPLGKWFDYLFPIFILLPVSATFFNLYGKIKRVFGFGMIDFEDEDEQSKSSAFGTGGWREGRDLIARDLNGQTSFSSRHATNTVTMGLAGSNRSSIDSTRANTTRSAQPSTNWSPPSQRPTGASIDTSRPQRTRPSAVTIDPEPDEENFFTLFGRRVKNTFETIDTPKWMSGNNNANGGGGQNDIPNPFAASNFKRPKWMGGDGDGGGGGGSDPNFIDRLFNNNWSSSSGGAGSGSDGRIVL